MRRWLWIFLAAMLLFSSALAAYQQSGDYTYDIKADGTALIVRYQGSEEHVQVPQWLDGYRVTEIGPVAFNNRRALRSATLPEGITTLGDYAFSGCTALERVELPDSLADTGANPFSLCEQLTEIVISLENPYLALIDGVLFSKPDKRLICYPDNLKASSYAVPEGIRIIGDSAFSRSGLMNIYLPDTLEVIGTEAFGWCSSLQNVPLPSHLQTIGDKAFISCWGLTELRIPGSVKVIGSSDSYSMVFSGCINLKSLTLEEGVEAIGMGAFLGNMALEQVTLPRSLRSIGDDAFGDCTSLQAIELPEQLHCLGSIAFFGCTALESIALPASLTQVGGWPFRECTALMEITLAADHPALIFDDGALIHRAEKRLIGFLPSAFLMRYTVPEGVEVIGEYAFAHCSHLTQVVLPESLREIGQSAFYDCTALADIILPQGLRSIGETAFLSCPALREITIPAGVEQIGRWAFDFDALLHVTRGTPAAAWAKENNAYYTYDDLNDWLTQ